MIKQTLPREWIERIFMRLHGRFGNEFLNKFRTGQIENGVDIGIENAKQTWAEELAGCSPDRIKNGLATTFAKAPSSDEFKLACRSTPDYHKEFLALPSAGKTKTNAEIALQKLSEIRKNLGWMNHAEN